MIDQNLLEFSLPKDRGSLTTQLLVTSVGVGGNFQKIMRTLLILFFQICELPAVPDIFFFF